MMELATGLRVFWRRHSPLKTRPPRSRCSSSPLHPCSPYKMVRLAHRLSRGIVAIRRRLRARRASRHCSYKPLSRWRRATTIFHHAPPTPISTHPHSCHIPLARLRPHAGAPLVATMLMARCVSAACIHCASASEHLSLYRSAIARAHTHRCMKISGVVALSDLAVLSRSCVCALTPTGSRPHKDRQEGFSPHHREVLPSPHHRLPDQQARVQRDRHHPFQASAQQGRWLHHPLDAPHREGPRPRHLVQAPGGGARAQGQLRPRDLGRRHLARRG